MVTTCESAKWSKWALGSLAIGELGHRCRRANVHPAATKWPSLEEVRGLRRPGATADCPHRSFQESWPNIPWGLRAMVIRVLFLLGDVEVEFATVMAHGGEAIEGRVRALGGRGLLPPPWLLDFLGVLRSNSR